MVSSTVLKVNHLIKCNSNTTARLSDSKHLNGHTKEIDPQTFKLEPPYTAQ